MLRERGEFIKRFIILVTCLIYLENMSSEIQNQNLPPNQYVIKNILQWGRAHPTIGKIPKIDLSKWILVIDGELEHPLILNWKKFLKLPKTESISNFHCVEGWSVLNIKWEGVKFSYIVSLVKPKETVKHVSFECLDGYTTSLLLADLMGDDVLLTYKINGKYLEENVGAPLRLIIPDKYAYKSAMWISKIKFTSKKEIGYWESRGYSDTADVWKNDRFEK